MMGLIRAALRMVPYAAIGVMGYYIGTIKSDQYHERFESNCIQEYRMEDNGMGQNELEMRIEDDYRGDNNG